MNFIDQLYTKFRKNVATLKISSVPYIRRFVRFLALPYAYFFIVNWKICKASPLKVAIDFLYIFFVLKDFPDNYTYSYLWEKDRSEWKYYYGSIYNPYQKGRLKKEIQKPEYEIVFEDKYICNQLCESAKLPVPELLGVISQNDDYQAIIKDIAIKQSPAKIMIKKCRGKGGKDIFVAFKKGDKVVVSDNKQVIDLDAFKINTEYVIQKFIDQHPNLKKISESVNTIRAETLLTKKSEVLIIAAFIRFGRKQSFVDNASSGGVGVGIDLQTGHLLPIGTNKKGERLSVHPDSGYKFENVKIPFWEEVIELIKKIQLTFPYYKFLGPDIAITPSGPVIVEINGMPDHNGIESRCGPILKDEKIREEFKNYNLLINKQIMSV